MYRAGITAASPCRGPCRSAVGEREGRHGRCRPRAGRPGRVAVREPSHGPVAVGYIVSPAPLQGAHRVGCIRQTVARTEIAPLHGTIRTSQTWLSAVLSETGTNGS